MLKASWYRLIVSAIITVPALVCQTILPVIPFPSWESASEAVYAALLRYYDQLADTSSRAPTQVVVLEIDQKTIDAYGWPIDRSYYLKTLERLEQSGHPWLLSMLQFQALERQKSSAEPTEIRAAKDQALAQAIRSYGRYIGTGLEVVQGSVLDANQEDELMPRITLSAAGRAPEELPTLPLRLVEDDRFVDAQKAFGFSTRFGTESVIHCMQTYITDAAQRGEFVIPSSLIWASAFAGEARLVTSAGAEWPRRGEEAPFPLRRRLAVSYKQCVGNTGVTTLSFLASRGIQRLSLVDFLTRPDSLPLANKVVILAREDMRRFRGPGIETASDSGIIEEHLLAARFLDDLLTGDFIRRDKLDRNFAQSWLPLAAAALLALSSLFWPIPGMLLGAAGLALTLLGTAVVSLLQGRYLIPIQTLVSVALTGTGLGGLYAYLRYYGVKRQVRFAQKLNESLSQCNTLAEVEALTKKLCEEEFGQARLEFTDFDRKMYEASSDPHQILALLERRQDQHSPEAAGQFSRRIDTIITRVRQPRGLARMPLRSFGLEVQLAVESELGRLGTARLSLACGPHEEGFIASLMETLRVELCQHWHRIKLLVDQKLLDYKVLMERSRGEIMGRFLTQVLVAKFSDSRTMEENLRLVLTPRPTRAALMQADIRGYSKVSAKMPPAEMVRLLQGYFRHAVDAAQLVAQVKLIGDCIFLFIEEEAAKNGSSPADLAFDVARILVASTLEQNARRAAQNLEGLHFGIAIHYGEVVVGNLSSDMCIDYTVIGPNVNFVARLEELTKSAVVEERIGRNGILISQEAMANLTRHRALPTATLALDQLGLVVRSFPEVRKVQALTAADILAEPAPEIAAVRKAG